MITRPDWPSLVADDVAPPSRDAVPLSEKPVRRASLAVTDLEGDLQYVMRAPAVTASGAASTRLLPPDLPRRRRRIGHLPSPEAEQPGRPRHPPRHRPGRQPGRHRPDHGRVPSLSRPRAQPARRVGGPEPRPGRHVHPDAGHRGRPRDRSADRVGPPPDDAGAARRPGARRGAAAGATTTSTTTSSPGTTATGRRRPATTRALPRPSVQGDVAVGLHSPVHSQLNPDLLTGDDELDELDAPTQRSRRRRQHRPPGPRVAPAQRRLLRGHQAPGDGRADWPVLGLIDVDRTSSKPRSYVVAWD